MKASCAGTLESGDIRIEIIPGGQGMKVELHSSVANQFGHHIKSILEATARQSGLDDCVITAVDKGALDCTIEARMRTAALRAFEADPDFYSLEMIK